MIIEHKHGSIQLHAWCANTQVPSSRQGYAPVLECASECASEHFIYTLPRNSHAHVNFALAAAVSARTVADTAQSAVSAARSVTSAGRPKSRDRRIEDVITAPPADIHKQTLVRNGMRVVRGG